MSGSEEPREILGVVRQVLRDRRELTELLKSYQMERQRRDSEQRVVEGRLEGVERARGSLNETLQAAEDRVKELLGEVERAKREGMEGVREQKGKNAQLATKLRQSEHRVKQREVHIDKMNSKLEAMVRKMGGRERGGDGRRGDIDVWEDRREDNNQERFICLFSLSSILLTCFPRSPPLLLLKRQRGGTRSEIT